MEFGKLKNIKNVTWSLSEDDPLNAPFLNSLTKNASADPKKTKFFVGAPAWGCKTWVGKIYPPKTPVTQFLNQYSRNFNCIELNTTHYRIPTPENVASWVSKVPSDFLFCPKMPKSISHESGGLRDAETLGKWIEAIKLFGLNLGPCFLQLPPNFSYAFKADLFHLLKAWPSSMELLVELRHPSWFKDGRVFPALTEYLQSRKIGLVITDVSGRRDVLHSSVSAPYSMLRFIGNELHSSDFSRTRAWAERISQWQKMGIKKFFFIVHQPNDTLTPESADSVIAVLNELCGAGLSPLHKPLLG